MIYWNLNGNKWACRSTGHILMYVHSSRNIPAFEYAHTHTLCISPSHYTAWRRLCSVQQSKLCYNFIFNPFRFRLQHPNNPKETREIEEENACESLLLSFSDVWVYVSRWNELIDEWSKNSSNSSSRISDMKFVNKKMASIMLLSMIR